MNEIDIETLAELLDYDPVSGVFRWREREGNAVWNGRNAGRVAGTTSLKGYRRIAIGGVLYSAHRIAWALSYGEWPKDQLDHINGKRADNRIENLREATNAENSRNRKVRKDNTSGYPGVVFDKATGKWRSRLRKGEKEHWFGFHDTKEEAIEARKEGERIHGYTSRLT